MSHFSYSRVGCYKQCPYQYYLNYIKKLEVLQDYEENNPLILGSTIHLAIEKGLEEARKYYFSQYPVVNDNHINEFMKIEYLVPKVKQLLPKGEHEVKIEDENFLGFIDYLTEDSIFDYKYSNNIDSYMNSGQLHIYKHFFEKMFNREIKNLNYIFLPKIQIRQKKTEDLFQFRKRLSDELEKAEVRVMRVEYNPTKVKEYLDAVEEIKAATEFPKNETRLCSWCQFEPYCKRKEDIMVTLPENKRRDLSQHQKKKIWIYGASFAGKTTLANKFPDVLMLNTDGNISNVDAPYLLINDIVKTEGRIVSRVMGWEVFLDVLETLEQKQNTFKTIVVDLLEDIFELCRAYTFKELGIEHESDAGFGKGYDIVRKRYLDAMKRLTNMNYENIILLSKEDISKSITRKGGEVITTIRPDIQDKVANKLAGMVDIVARAYVENDKYYLSFKSNEFVFGGGRLGVKGQEITSSYEEVMRIYNEMNKPTDSKTETVAQPQTTERRRVAVSENK